MLSSASAYQDVFRIFGLPQQLSKPINPTIHLSNDVKRSPVDFARNLGVIHTNLSFAQQFSAVSKSCFHDTCDPRRIHNYVDKSIAYSIATPLIHSICNSLILYLPATQTNRL